MPVFHDQRTVNTRLLGAALAALCLLGVGTHFLHAYQVKRNARALLVQADRAEEEGRWRDCGNFLARYLAYRPHDLDALARYGLVVDRFARRAEDRWRALSILEKVLRLDPDR